LFFKFFVLVKHSIQQQLPTGDEYDDEQVEQPVYTAPARRNPWGLQSYKQIIIEAIENSPSKRLSLNEVYQYFIDNNKYFRDRQKKDQMDKWKNSIRHNLSLHKETFQRFQKVDPNTKKQNSYWTLVPPMPKSLKKQQPQHRQVLDTIVSGHEAKYEYSEQPIDYPTENYYEARSYDQQPTTIIQSNRNSSSESYAGTFGQEPTKISNDQFENVFMQQQMHGLQSSNVTINQPIGGWSREQIAFNNASPIPKPHPQQDFEYSLEAIEMKPDDAYMLNEAMEQSSSGNL